MDPKQHTGSLLLNASLTVGSHFLFQPDPGIEPTSPELAGKFFTSEPPGKP